MKLNTTNQTAVFLADVTRAHTAPFYKTANRLPFLPSNADPHHVLSSEKLYPPLAVKIAQLVSRCHAQGLNVMAWEGFRDNAKQNELFARGGVTAARGGLSWHNHGLAVDVVFDDGHGKPSWGTKHPWRELGAIGRELGLSWGGDFRRLKDLGHFEYHPGLTVSRALELSRDGGSQNVWQNLEGR